MRTRTYRLYATSTATASAVASARIIGGGKLTAANFVIAGTAGAGTTGIVVTELSLVNAGQITSNDTNGNVIAHSCAAAQVNAGSFGANSLLAGLAVDVQDGDYLYMHVYVQGTAPANTILSIDVTCAL